MPLHPPPGTLNLNEQKWEVFFLDFFLPNISTFPNQMSGAPSRVCAEALCPPHPPEGGGGIITPPPLTPSSPIHST